MNLEKGKHQLERQTRFIDSYKAESDKVKENTEKKWRELKRLYEGQLESMEQRLRAAEAREKSLLVQLDQTDRQCKEYEFELTMSTDIKDVDYRNWKVIMHSILLAKLSSSALSFSRWFRHWKFFSLPLSFLEVFGVNFFSLYLIHRTRSFV